MENLWTMLTGNGDILKIHLFSEALQTPEGLHYSLEPFVSISQIFVCIGRLRIKKPIKKALQLMGDNETLWELLLASLGKYRAFPIHTPRSTAKLFFQIDQLNQFYLYFCIGK
jgi:hypothetical protein